MAGTINLSLSQQFDMLGKPLAGGLLYIRRAGTTDTPQNAFQDLGLAIPWPNPIVLDAAGRVPAFYLADGQIKIRLTDKNGVQQLIADNLLVIGPSSGTGSTGGVDPTTLISTGNIILRYGTGALAGYVRLNNRTIGSATSAATERANADCQVLFEQLWNTDPNLVVAPSRGATSIADWTANKTLQLPDGRNRLLAGLGDMGNAPSTLLNGCVFTTGNSTTLGSSYGAGRYQLVTGNVPSYTPSGAVSGSFSGSGSGSGTASTTGVAGFVPGGAGLGGSGNQLNNANLVNPATFPVSVNVNVSGGISATFAGNNNGGTSTPFDINSPTLLITYYIKL